MAALLRQQVMLWRLLPNSGPERENPAHGWASGRILGMTSQVVQRPRRGRGLDHAVGRIRTRDLVLVKAPREQPEDDASVFVSTLRVAKASAPLPDHSTKFRAHHLGASGSLGSPRESTSTEASRVLPRKKSRDCGSPGGGLWRPVIPKNQGRDSRWASGRTMR